MQKKFQIEKFLHEIIRDLPDAYRINRKYERGFITADECMSAIIEAYRAEKIRKSKEFWEGVNQA